MASAFPDVKPFPKASPAPAGIGSNSAAVPLEVQIVEDFVEGLERDGLIQRVKELTDRCSGVTGCASKEAAGNIGDVLKMASTAAKAIEEHREKHNRPLLTSQRALKAKADGIVADMTAATANARKHMDTFLAEQERQRREEAARIEREEREKREAAEAERRRLQAEEDARAAAEQREAAVVEVEPEPVFTAPKLDRTPVRGNYGSTVSVVETWDVEVLNIRQVPDAYLKHPTVIEALEKVIRPQVKGKNGLREIKGCRIFSNIGSAVR